FDVPTSPMYSFRHEHREHVLAWLAEKRQVAHQKESHQHRWTAVAAVAGGIAAVARGGAGWPRLQKRVSPRASSAFNVASASRSSGACVRITDAGRRALSVDA